MIRVSLLTIAMGLSVMTVQTAAAQDERAVHVPYGDLNLSSKAGVAALERRVAKAVYAVCDSEQDGRDLEALEVSRSCQKTAEAGARVQMVQAIAAAGAHQPFSLAVNAPR